MRQLSRYRTINRRSFLRTGTLGAIGAGCFSLAAPLRIVAAATTYDVRDYGAKGDGLTLDTAAVNKAIDTAAAAGGGTVAFPPGNYLCYTIRLKSNITLFLDQGATVIAADQPQAGQPGYDNFEPNIYGDLVYQDFGHSHWRNSLIWGEQLEHISILGPGRIWGRGLLRDGGTTQGQGNKSISLKWCRNVNLKDFSVYQGGWFVLLATGVDNMTISNIKIDTNRDGFDIDCCKNVRMSDCSINSPLDDAICLKSSYGLGMARSTDNVTITNCQVSGYRWEPSSTERTSRLPTEGEPAASSSARNPTAASATLRYPIACSIIATGWPSKAWTARLSKTSRSTTSRWNTSRTRRSSFVSARG